MEFEPAHSVGEPFFQHLDDLEQEPERKDKALQTLVDHFGKVDKVLTPSNGSIENRGEGPAAWKAQLPCQRCYDRMRDSDTEQGRRMSAHMRLLHFL